MIDPFSLRIDNIAFARLDHVLVFDKIPAGYEFVSLTIPDEPHVKAFFHT